MRKYFFRLISIALLLTLLLPAVLSCGKNVKKPAVLIYSSLSNEEEKKISDELSAEFPNAEITLTHLDRWDGRDMPDNTFCFLIGYDNCDESIDSFSLGKESYTFAMNVGALSENGFENPKSFDALTDSGYANLLAIPNPASSDAGYAVLLALANKLGDNEAAEYYKTIYEMSAFSEDENEALDALVSMKAAVGICQYDGVISAIDDGKPLAVLSGGSGIPYVEKKAYFVSEDTEFKDAPDFFGFMKEKFEYIRQNKSLPYDSGEYADMSRLGDETVRQALIGMVK